MFASTASTTSTADFVLAPVRIAPLESPLPLAFFDAAPTDDDLARVTFYVPTYEVTADSLQHMKHMPQLRVCQLLTAGFEHALPWLPDGVALCNARGVHDSSTAEIAVALMLASLRGLDDAARNMTDGLWDHRTHHSLADRRVLVVGVGGVGRAIVQRLEAFEVEVTRVGRTARHGVHGFDELPTLLPSAEVVVLAVPLDTATRHLVNDDFLSRMADHALLVNVSRGGVVDTEALLTHTQSGHIRAALDVTDPEPLPADHPLWHAPGVLISPHVGGDSSAFEPRARRLVERQLTRWAAGEPLEHVVAG